MAAAPTGLLVVNRLPIEDYLSGVVNAEMGRRAPGEQAALEAQAIVSRTVALRAVGRFRTRGYDLVATVADQVYGGTAAELEQGRVAVGSTRGLVLSWAGQPIDAFFHSTCGGRTAAGDEAFAHGARPYLRSVWDTAPDGAAWCVTSPRFTWSESWDGTRLTTLLGRTLTRRGLPPGAEREVGDLSVTAHTGSGRVETMAIRFRDRAHPITGSAAVREVFQDDAGRPLRSAAFRLVTTRAGDRLARVTVVGAGAGHGVGMCQWGAVGRARAGHPAARILAAYFPGAVLERRW
jgi:stage II sporulation protein D